MRLLQILFIFLSGLNASADPSSFEIKPNCTYSSFTVGFDCFSQQQVQLFGPFSGQFTTPSSTALTNPFAGAPSNGVTQPTTPVYQQRSAPPPPTATTDTSTSAKVTVTPIGNSNSAATKAPMSASDLRSRMGYAAPAAASDSQTPVAQSSGAAMSGSDLAARMGYAQPASSSGQSSAPQQASGGAMSASDLATRMGYTQSRGTDNSSGPAQSVGALNMNSLANRMGYKTAPVQSSSSGSSPQSSGGAMNGSDLAARMGYKYQPVPQIIEQSSGPRDVPVTDIGTYPYQPHPKTEEPRANQDGYGTFAIPDNDKVESRPLDDHPVTPILPGQQARQILESACEDCLKEKEYEQKFSSLKDISDNMPGVGSALRTAAHNMMKVVHMNCDADKMFVPSDYVTNLEYCGGTTCDRLGHITGTYMGNQLDQFKNDRVNGDTYRTDLSPEVAQTRVSNSPTDKRTCQDLHDKPFLFMVGGRANYSKDKIDPFDYQALRGSTDGVANTVDCMATINEVFAAAGLKFSPNDKTPAEAYSHTTGAVVSIANSKNSCVSKPVFKGDDSIHTGDVIVIQRSVEGSNDRDFGHAFMFDDVKEDPFNLKAVKDSSGCSDLDPSKFRFSILQSSGTQVDRQAFERFKGIDLSIEQNFKKFDNVYGSQSCHDNYGQPASCDLRERFEDWGAQVLEIAKKACLAKFTGIAMTPGETLESRRVTQDKQNKIHKTYSTSTLMRHKGATEVCSFPKPPEIVGAKCVANCLSK